VNSKLINRERTKEDPQWHLCIQDLQISQMHPAVSIANRYSKLSSAKERKMQSASACSMPMRDQMI
jgi:hypothetical protein